MSAKKAVREILLQDADVRDIFGTRIRPNVRLQSGMLPCVVMDVDTNEDHAFCSAGASGVATATMSLYCYHDSALEADNGAQAVFDALHGASGTYNGVVVQICVADLGVDSDAILVDEDSEEYVYERTVEVPTLVYEV